MGKIMEEIIAIRRAALYEAMGRVKEKTDPLPGWLVTEIVPPCDSTMAFEIGSPIPVP